jgi:adenylate cyclase
VPALPIAPGLASPSRWRDRLHALLERTAAVAVLPDDPEEERVRKAALILLVALIVPLSTVWVVTYAVLGLWWSAVIPLAYQVLSTVGLAAFVRTKRFQRFRTVELSLMLLLPFVLQWSLGGFRASSAVAVWAFVAPMAALVFVGPGRAWWWLAGYAVLLVASTVFEFTAPDARGIPQGVAISFFFLNIGALSLVTYLLLRYFVQERERALKALDRQHRLLQVERANSERLLLNVLPQSIAERLKEREGVIADAFSHVTVLFADIVGFTPYAERFPPDTSVQTLNELFSDFDALAKQAGLRRSRPSGTPTWWPVGCRSPRRTTRRRSRTWAWRCWRRPPTGRCETASRSGSGSASTLDRSLPGSSGDESSSTTCGATRSTPPVAWSRTACPGTSR